MARKAKEEKKEPETKEEALEMLLTSLEKDFGEGAVLTNKSIFPNIERIPSGSFSLDRILNGGYARGRIIEISGPESSSKTTCSLHAIAECQKMGGTCAFIDVEHALDINYAMAIGVNREKLLVCQPESGEQALNIVDRFVRSGIIDLIVVDSVAALVPQSELEGAVGDSKMGLQARMMSQAMRMLVGATAKTNTTIIFINQIRMKIGVYYGSPEVSPGGEALKFYCSQRLDLRRKEVLADGEDKNGIRVQAKVVKNKVGPPFGLTQFNVMFGKGISYYEDIVTLAEAEGIFKKAGSWYSYGEIKIGQGTAGAACYLEEHPDILEEVKEKLKPKIL